MPERIDIRYEEREESLYPLLQTLTKEHLHKLSGKIWTDQYVHDPGVTINDVLNYVLTDFHYKLQFSVEDYLCRENQCVDLELLGLFNILQVSLFGPVTVLDYQNMIRERIPDIYKISFIPLKGEDQRGLYTIEAFVYADVAAERYKEIKEAIKELYYNHRNLCEDLEEIKITAAGTDCKRDHSIDFRDFLDDDNLNYPKGQYRDIFNHPPARFDFPKFYGINDWGLSPEASEERKRSAAQLKKYLSLFDGVIERGLAELKSLPLYMQLTPDTPTEECNRIKLQYLDMLDKIYGENSNPEFIFTPDGGQESCEECIQRRVGFLKKVPFWGRDKQKVAWKSHVEVFGLEAYFGQLLGLTDKEHIRIVEHIFFRNQDDIIGSMFDEPENLPLELNLSIFIYGNSERMQRESFVKGVEALVLKRIPAHIQVASYLLFGEEANRVEQLYQDYISDLSYEHTENLKQYIIEKRKG